MSEVRGSREETPCIRGQGGGREELPRVQGQWWQGGDTPHQRSGVAGRRHPMCEVKGGRKKPPHTPGQG